MDVYRFKLFGSDGRHYVWQKPRIEIEKNLVPTIKFDGRNIMVWDCLDNKIIKKLAILPETLNLLGYANLPDLNLNESLIKMVSKE